jgi:macrodomain Ter protein organizer (MatP/YcbG family)
MNNLPEYKSIKLTFAAWQAVTRMCAHTGEPRTRLLERIIQEAEKRLDRERLETAAKTAYEVKLHEVD